MSTIILKRSLLSLEPMGEFFQTVAMQPFQIEGIGVWGARPGDAIERMQIGPEIANASAAGYVPAQFYSMDHIGYSELAACIESNKALPLSWGPDYFLGAGNMLRLRMSPSRPELQIAVWGLQLIAFSQEDLENLPQDYYGLLDRERAVLMRRVEQIDAVKRPPIQEK